MKTAQADRAANSFEVVAREWYTKQAPTWAANHGDRILRRLERDIFPWLGGRPIAEINAPELLGALRRIENRGAVETAHRALQNCGQIFRYAVATGRAERDPSGDLKGTLPPVKGGHFAAVTDPKQVAELLRAWLTNRGLKPAFFFPTTTDAPDYLDPSNPRYAPKLEAAVRAWQAVTDLNGKHPKQALKKWLREHAAEFGLTDDDGKPNETGIEEAAKMANWQPGGGAPKTPANNLPTPKSRANTGFPGWRGQELTPPRPAEPTHPTPIFRGGFSQ